MENILRKREIPTAIIFIVVLFIVAEYFTVAVKPITSKITSLGIYITAFALIVGIFNLFGTHLRSIQRRKEGIWPFSLWFFIVYFIMVVVGFIPPIGTNSTYMWMFKYMKLPLDATAYAILGFFIFTAAARMFRVRNIDSLILVTAALFGMLKNAPIGASIWGGFPIIGNWINDVISASGMRGITLGIALGVIGMSLRIMLGYEKGALGGSE